MYSFVAPIKKDFTSRFPAESLSGSITVTVGRDRETRTTRRANQIAGFVTVPSWKKINSVYFSLQASYTIFDILNRVCKHFFIILNNYKYTVKKIVIKKVYEEQVMKTE